MYHLQNTKLSNSQLNQIYGLTKNQKWYSGNFKSCIKYSNMVGDSNNETNFQHILLFTNTHISFKAL